MKEVIDNKFEGLVDMGKHYEFGGSIRRWEDKKENKKNERKLIFELYKPLVIKGDFVVNGFVTTIYSIGVKGINRVGNNY